MIVVDAGANIGFHSLLAASLVGPGGHVYACEPNSENCRLILLSIIENQITNIKLLPVALGERIGYAPFAPNTGSNGAFLHSSSDVLTNPACVIVPVFPLDQLVTGRVDFIKADVEGAEGLVFKGAINIIRQHRPIVVSEFSPILLNSNSQMDPGDYLAMFATHGYQTVCLGREGPAGIISSIDDFIAGYGSQHRIEDLAFIPRERT